MPGQKINAIEGKNLDGEKVTLLKSQPLQLCLFQHFIQDEKRYSNVIDLYDAAPKYFSSAKQMDAMRKDGTYLPTLERTFKHRNPITGTYDDYILEIRPARIKRNNKEIECYPSEREEIIEEALRKLAVNNLKGFYFDKNAGIEFTLYELRNELKRMKHEMRLDTIIESLTVCNRANISIKTADKKSLLTFAIFPTLLISNRSDWLSDPKNTKCYVQFNNLVTMGIDSLSYRQHDYIKWMSYKKQLTRWLHKKIYYNYINAAVGQNYSLLASSIIRDSNLVNNKQLRDKFKAIEQSLQELKNNDTICDFNKHLVKQEKKIIDIKYELIPSFRLIADMKNSNKRNSQIGEQHCLVEKADNIKNR